MAKFAARDLVLSVSDTTQTGLSSVASTDVFTKTAHGLAAGDAVVFSALTGGAGLTVGKRYYVIAAGLTANDFAVSLTPGGSSFNHTTNVTAGSFAKQVPVAQVLALGDAGSTRELIDASAYGDAYKDYVTGQQDGSELEIELALDPADTSHGVVKAAYDAGTSRYFGMRLAAAAFDISFPAMVTSYARGGERDGLLHVTASLKIIAPGVIEALV